MNYYIVPGEKYQISAVRNQIGEDLDLNAFMSDVIADIGKYLPCDVRESLSRFSVDKFVRV